jgi:fructosamine-3-kinase
MNEVLIKALLAKNGRSLESCRPVGGGCINAAYRVITGSGSYFIKLNKSDAYPGMFEAEAKGLELLAASTDLIIPRVVDTGSDAGSGISYILLEWIEAGVRGHSFWRQFGISLAKMHRHSSEYFGLGHDNYIGSLPQSNTRAVSWPAFFITSRLQPQLKLAVENGLVDPALQKKFELLFEKIGHIFPAEPPALLHGDLWNGNFMASAGGAACLFDPAVYYGHREMDLAMSRLFGGFDEDFYAAYMEAYPLQPGWQQRVDLCNLYPLLVHVNLFGAAYVNQVRAVLEKFAG